MDDWLENYVDPNTNTYNRERIYKYAVDKNGHSMDLRTKVPTWVETMLQDIVSSPNNPFTNFAQIVRDSIIHQAHYYRQRMGDDAPRTLDISLARAHMEDMRNRRVESEDFIRVANQEFDSLAEQDRAAFRVSLEMALVTVTKALRPEVQKLLNRLDRSG